MEEKVTSSMQLAINNTISQMEKLVNDIEANINQPTTFNMAIRTFSGAASELISFISNPAIRVVDTSGNSHFMVGGEKWKLFISIDIYHSVNGNDEIREMTFTNPVDLKYETILISKRAAAQALQDYESLYDSGIQNVMRINAEAANIAKASTNIEKVAVLRKTIELIKEAMKVQLDFYSSIKQGS